MTLRNPIVGEALVPEGQGAEGPHGPGVPLGRQGHTRRSHRDKGEGARGGAQGQAGRRSSQAHLGTSVPARGQAARALRCQRAGRRGGRTQPTRAAILSSWRQTTHCPGSSSAPPLLGGFRFRPELPPFFLSPLLSPQLHQRGREPSYPRGKVSPEGSLGQYLGVHGAQIPCSGHPGARAPQNERATRKRRSDVLLERPRQAQGGSGWAPRGVFRGE